MTLKLQEFLPYRFNRLAEELSRNASAAYQTAYGMSRPEWRVFALLGEYGMMTATEISRLSAMDKTKVSRAVVALEKKRWLLRKSDQKDRRVEKISLTPEGRAQYQRLVPEILKIESDLISSLGDTDSKALMQGLAALEKLLIR